MIFAYILCSDVWELEKFKYDWPTPDMKIYQNFYPCGIEAASAETSVKHGIFVQSLNGNKEEAGRFSSIYYVVIIDFGNIIRGYLTKLNENVYRSNLEFCLG